MRRNLVAVAAVVVLMTPVIYVGALGPLVWLDRRGYIAISHGSAIDWAYRPLAYLEVRSPMASQAVRWYVSLWEPPQEPVPPVRY